MIDKLYIYVDIYTWKSVPRIKLWKWAKTTT